MSSDIFARVLGITPRTNLGTVKKSAMPSLDIAKTTPGYARILKGDKPQTAKHGNYAHATRMCGLFRNA